MAKQIRKCWVYKKNNRWWRVLPRRDDGHMKFNYDDGEGSLQSFTDRMPCENPPKLWVAWLYRDPTKKNAHEIRMLFGDNAQAGTMNVFKNTFSTNKALWRVKNLIDIRPMSFPNGEPTAADVGTLEIGHDGRCALNVAPDPRGVRLFDETRHFLPSYLSSRLISRDKAHKDVYEDNVYNPSNISVID